MLPHLGSPVFPIGDRKLESLVMQPLFALGMSPMGLLLIAVIVILLFGSNRLPTLFRSLGRSVTEFKKG
ncbi:MAG TPA: twin-arginine translocase TatA/TatE family subunit, partial [Pirellulales bacterium]|nr:twin-arginine translocase TatA/TatE family subunit [Pirellulales bacterium]